MEIVILLGLIVLNGLFAMSEIAIVTAKKSRLAILAANGSRSARAALDLASDPTPFLSTVQIGITSIGIMNGIFGESVLAKPFALWLHSLGMKTSISGPLATVLVVVVVTYLSIVVGELVPKRIGQIMAERIACAVARPMQWLAIGTKPFVLFLSASTRGLVRLLGFHRIAPQTVTEEDIHALLEEGSSTGVLEEHEHTMVKNVLRLEERSISSMMVPRTDLVYLDVDNSLQDNLNLAVQSRHSRFPVCRGNRDNVLGMVSVKDLLAAAVKGSATGLEELVDSPHAVPESLTGVELLELFRSSHSQMVFVVDEYGDVKGIVTLQDLLETLTGEFDPDGDGEAYVIKRDDGSLLLDGMLSIVDVKDCLKASKLPHEDDYETLNGLMMRMMDKMPQTGDKISLNGWILEVVDMDGRRIDKVLAIKHPEQWDLE